MMILKDDCWSNRLPEIDIIPLKEEACGYTLTHLLYQKYNNEEDTPVAKTKKTKSLASMDYKNPFTYVNCNFSAKPKTAKPVEPISTKWTCMICNEATANKETLIDHYEVHKNEKPEDPFKNIEDYFKCVICASEFTSSRSYERHLEIKHGENPFACKLCKKTYRSLFQLCVHNFNLHTTDGRYKCIVCNLSTVNKSEMRAHIKEHETNNLFQCDICDKKFLSSAWFEDHKNSHIGAMPFECEVCRNNFPSSHYLVSHKRSMHPQIYSGKQTSNTCHLCHKQFAHKKSLLLHIKSHTGENTVLCDMCGKSLSSTEHLRQHLRIHTGYKPHICGVCGKGFAKKSNLTLHERVHSGEKPYVCRNCGKSFSQRSTLVIHERYHSGERPYSCPLCEKGFVAKGLLGVHIKSCSRIVV